MEKPWYRERYVQFCALMVLSGCLVVGVDAIRTQARERDKERAIEKVIKAKSDGDALFQASRLEQAIASYDDALTFAKDDRLPDVERVKEAVLAAQKGREVAAHDREVQLEREAREDAERVRIAQEQLAEEERKRDEAEVARQENDPDFQSTLRQAKGIEETAPGIAARYYRDIAEIYPKTAAAKGALVKAKELWAGAYGNNEGPPHLKKCAKAGCNNRAPEGHDYCHLHNSPTPTSSYGVHIGPRGGVYHYSKNGKKVYHKR